MNLIKLQAYLTSNHRYQQQAATASLQTLRVEFDDGDLFAQHLLAHRNAGAVQDIQLPHSTRLETHYFPARQTRSVILHVHPDQAAQKLGPATPPSSRTSSFYLGHLALSVLHCSMTLISGLLVRHSTAHSNPGDHGCSLGSANELTTT